MGRGIRMGKALCMGAVLFFAGISGVRAQDKLHFGGYGETHYNGTDKKGAIDEVDAHRMVLGWSYIVTDRISIHTEVDFEHSAQEMELEFAYVNFGLSDAINVRAGTMLMPVGYFNEFHEPPLFFSVERPYVQKYIIPTTWQEGGTGIYGNPFPGADYRLYMVGGLDASNFKASSGIRSGRSKVSEAPAEDKAIVGRFDYSGIPYVRVGSSLYSGDAAQGDVTLGDASVSIVEGDLRLELQDFEFTGLYSQINVGDTAKINAATGRVIGEKMVGWYVEGAYHIGRLFMPGGQDIVIFVRHEQFNTQENVAAGFTADKANDRSVLTSGLAYYPDKKVVIKADIEKWENENNEDWVQFNLGIGFMF